MPPSPAQPGSLPARLARLTHRRWAIPVLAELASTRGCKLVWLERHVGAGKGPAKDALSLLMELGLAAPNPGYGHPLRPEYLPTPEGAGAGEQARSLLRAMGGLEDVEPVLRKWSLPVLLALAEGAERFREIKSLLPGATDRALAGALRELEESGLVERTIEDARPPRPRYAVLPAAGPLLGPARALASCLPDE
ncbi:MAG: winged helix-turn-helix transcriptional regulator [Phycisphaerales bacterium JB040]